MLMHASTGRNRVQPMRRWLDDRTIGAVIAMGGVEAAQVDSTLRTELARVVRRHNRQLTDRDGRAPEVMLDELVELFERYRDQTGPAVVRPVGKAQRTPKAEQP